MASRLDGMGDAYAQLKALGEVQEARVIRAALREAGKPILREMVSRAPVGDDIHRTYKGRLVAPGFLKRSIRFIVTRVKKTGAMFAVFGVRHEAFYGPAFLERGTVKRAADPWMVPAFDAAKDASVKAFVETLVKRVAAIARRARRAAR